MTPSRLIYLIFTTDGAGGAEKRLIGLWLSLKKEGFRSKLVFSDKLFQALMLQVEFKQLGDYLKDIIIVPFTGSVMGNTALVKKFINENVKAGDALHFVGYFPVFIKQKKDIDYLYSLTTCSFNNVNIKGKAYLLSSLARADRADILDPNIYVLARKYFFYKRGSIFQTSNSYVDADRYWPQYPKKPWIVFLGRFLEGKQIMRYIDAIPVIHQNLTDSGITDHHFYILGYGPLEAEVAQRLRHDDYKGIPVTLQRTHSPEEILCSSKIFLSLNAENNYPSKSLLEGLASGNIPVVTDVGTTDLIAPRSISTYIPGNFTPEELTEAIKAILMLPETGFQTVSDAARAFVMEHYTLTKMADYYLHFYKAS